MRLADVRYIKCALQAETENDYDVAHGNAVTGSELDHLDLACDFGRITHVPAGTRPDSRTAACKP